MHADSSTVGNKVQYLSWCYENFCHGAQTQTY